MAYIVVMDIYLNCLFVHADHTFIFYGYFNLSAMLRGLITIMVLFVPLIIGKSPIKFQEN